MEPIELLEGLRDHGFAPCEVPILDRRLLDMLYDRWANFFRSDEKASYVVQDGRLDGYFPWLAEQAVGADRPDPKEYFHVVRGCPVPAALADPTWRAFEALRSAAAVCLDALDASLMRGGVLSRMLVDDRRLVLPIARYLAPATRAQAFAAPHTDINLLTLLPPASAPGLQVRHHSGTWRDVLVEPGRAAVLVGDMLSEATGGALRASVHRVVSRRDERLSLSLFANPPDETRLSARCTAGEFFRQRLREMGERDA